MTPIGTFNQRMSIAVGAARCMVHSVYNAASEYYKLHRKLDVIEVTTLYKIRSWNVYPGAYIFMNFLRWNRQCRWGFHCGFWKLFVENNNLFLPKILIILLHSYISFNSNNIVGWNFQNKADVTSRDFKYEIADFPNNFIVSYPSRVSRNEFGR